MDFMHTLKDLQEHFDWSYMQTRKRVMWLRENFSSEVKGGQGSKYQVTDNGLTILDRLKQLEKDYEDLNSAFAQVKEEMQGKQREASEEQENQGRQNEKETVKTEQKSDKSELKTTKRYLEQLEKENDYLREKLDEKDRQLQEANQQIQRLITGKVEKEEEKKDEFKELGLIQVIKKWFTTKT